MVKVMPPDSTVKFLLQTNTLFITATELVRLNSTPWYHAAITTFGPLPDSLAPDL